MRKHIVDSLFFLGWAASVPPNLFLVWRNATYAIPWCRGFRVKAWLQHLGQFEKPDAIAAFHEYALAMGLLVGNGGFHF